MNAGAFGHWEKNYEEKDLTIVLQKSEKGVSCVSAVGEMLAKSRNLNVSQSEILGIIGEPAPIHRLRVLLNDMDSPKAGAGWHSGMRIEADIEFIRGRKNFAVILKEFGSEAHAVFIKGFEDQLMVLDTFDQSRYEMTVEEFQKVWTGAYIFYDEDK